MSGFLLYAVIYLSAAVICVPLAKKLGMGSVLGYLLAGIIIGPFVLGFIGEEGEDIMHFAEFGVVMMLFLVGLELDPAKLWTMKKTIVGMGTMQLALTSIIIFSIAFGLGFSWQASLAVSLALSMSSTAIVLQSLKEKGQLQSVAGKSSFAVLLYQDLAIIPILAILPLLATATVATEGSQTFIDDLPAWLKAIATFSAIIVVIVAGKFVIVPLLRLVAKTKLRELFSASSLLIIFAIAYLMQVVGLSPALGTFLAGVVLANSEFKHELESDLEPFKGLLLGLFFIAVGASIDFSMIAEQPLMVFGAVMGIVMVKLLVLVLIGRVFKLYKHENLLFSFSLSQVGEFAFVLFAYMGTNAILEKNESDFLMAVTALSMTVTPVLLLINEKIILPRMDIGSKKDQAADAVDERNAVIIAGFSHFGSTIGRFLRANGVSATILDNDPDRVDLLRKMGFKVFYGDATRIDLLESAGAEGAKIFVSAIDDAATNEALVETLKKHFPHLKLMMRTRHRYDAYELIEHGVQHVYRDHIDTSVRMGVDVLRTLGMRGYSAVRAGQNFFKFDEAALPKLAKQRHDFKSYIASVRAEIEHQEELLRNDFNFSPNDNDHAWDSEQMRDVIGKQQ
ncbi:MAG TPA: monovalent cation:proton antiporter-2 (CPA2) family protein [Chitinophagaceae bacterium]|nr:monovalent cation:proton antiporter-2 (CPA2) family protein [Chitinophagaceae bacterium]